MCPTCDKEFEVPKYLYNRTYCSSSCVTISRDSKFEREIVEVLSQKHHVEKLRLKLNNRTILPDIAIKNNIIECYGDYWHCNPNFYDENYYHSRIRKYACEVWKYDKERENILKENGYNVIIIWENEWKNAKENIIKKLNEIL